MLKADADKSYGIVLTQKYVSLAISIEETINLKCNERNENIMENFYCKLDAKQV